MKNKNVSLIELAKVFLTIGTIGFGGGLAIIALTQEYCVNKKKWLSEDEYTHGVALGQFMGPFAVNTAIFVGYRVRRLNGAIVALISFLAPSMIFVIILSALYMNYHKIPSFQAALRGISPAVLALILYAAYQMGKNKINSSEAVLLMLFAIFLSIVIKLEVIVILLLAIVYGFIKIRFFEGDVKNEDS